MAKGRNRADGKQEHGVGGHLGKQTTAQEVGIGPGLEQRLGGERRLGLRALEEVGKDRAELIAATGDRGLVEHGAALHEEDGPQAASGFETFGAEGFYPEA